VHGRRSNGVVIHLDRYLQDLLDTVDELGVVDAADGSDP